MAAIFISLAGYGAYLHFKSLHAKIMLETAVSKAEYEPGDTVEITLSIRSSGKVSSGGVISTRLITPDTEKILPAIFIDNITSATQKLLLEYGFAEDDKPGKYILISKLQLESAGRLKEVVQKESVFRYLERKKPAERPQPAASQASRPAEPKYTAHIETVLYPDAVMGTFSFDEKIALGGSIKNNSDARGEAKLSLTVVAPDEASRIMSSTIRLLEKETKRFDFDYVPDTGKDPGRYLAVYEAKSGTKSSDRHEAAFFLYDRSPEVSIKSFPLKALIGKTAVVEVEVTDDKMVKEAVIFYRLPRQRKYQSRQMDFVSGSRLKGVWKHETARFDDTGRYIFYIEAKDSINQSYKTKEHIIRVVDD